VNNRELSLQVVIPTIGRSSDLNNLILDLGREVRRSPTASLSVTIVDDGSGSDFGFAQEDPDLLVDIVRNLTSQGAASARNLGASQSNSEWIAFIDDDVRLPHGWLRALTELLYSSEADMIGGEVKSIAAKNWFSQASEDFIVRHKQYPEGWYLVSAHMFCRREAFETLNGFDAERFNRGCGSEDWDLCRRAHSAGLVIDVSHTVYCRHQNPTSWNDFLKRARSYGRASRLLDQVESESSEHVRIIHEIESSPKTPTANYFQLIQRASSWPIREYRTLRGLGRSRARSFRNSILYVPWMSTYLLASRNTSHASQE
jgi:GT2 family glycosyltransferase